MAAAVKNDNTNDVMYEAFSAIDIAVHDLRMTSWAMECTADVSHKLPDGCNKADIGFYFAKVLAMQAERLSAIAGSAHGHLKEMRRVAR